MLSSKKRSMSLSSSSSSSSSRQQLQQRRDGKTAAPAPPRASSGRAGPSSASSSSPPSAGNERSGGGSGSAAILFFCWYRPLGAPLGTFRLTLEEGKINRGGKAARKHRRPNSKGGGSSKPAAASQQQQWALKHPWKDAMKVMFDSDSSSSGGGGCGVGSDGITAIEVAFDDCGDDDDDDDFSPWTSLCPDPLDGEGDAGVGVGGEIRTGPSWVDVCRELGRRRRRSPGGGGTRSLSFLGGGRSASHRRAAAAVLEELRPSLRNVRLERPESCSAAFRQLLGSGDDDDDGDGFKNKLLELEIRYGAPLSASECSDLSRLLLRLRSVSIVGTRLASAAVADGATVDFGCWNAVFEGMESSRSLERVSWDDFFESFPQRNGGNSDNNRNSDGADVDEEKGRIKSYLEGKHRLNMLRRVLLEDLELRRAAAVAAARKRGRSSKAAAAVAGRGGFSKSSTIDSAVEVVHEWWRSTHRPPNVPPTGAGAGAAAKAGKQGAGAATRVRAVRDAKTTGCGSASSKAVEGAASPGTRRSAPRRVGRSLADLLRER